MATKPNQSNERVIADTSALVSLVVDVDTNHPTALRFFDSARDRRVEILLPGDILTETLNILAKKASKTLAIQTGDLLLSSPAITVLEASDLIRKQALVKFGQQPGSVSYTDCIVMAFADEYHSPIFGFDEAFTRNGYTAAQ